MDARALTTLVSAVLPRAWRRDSEWHGEAHWRCVAATGLELADAVPGANRTLVLCFGLLHDTRRENEHRDPAHGRRAAAFARELAAEDVLVLDGRSLAVLASALQLHADGLVSDEPTTGVCWDADRLHLPRVWIDPDPALFSTSAAHDPGRLSAAEAQRAAPPPWEEIVARVAIPGASGLTVG